MLSLKEGTFLVRLARQAIVTALQTGTVLTPPPQTPKSLQEHRGAFVTLHRVMEGEKLLRGCIGVPLPVKPLSEAVVEAALGAAFRDPRFPGLQEDELDHVTVEVSILTPPQLVGVSDPLEYPAKIRVGQDGLLVEGEWGRGLLLPQVAVEHQLDATTFLEQACLKAGLPKDAWRKGTIRLHTFQAQIFAEETPNGPVKEILLTPRESSTSS